ncbi:MAG: DEAD/DEAH box helicase [Desulfitobacteriia bacterium]
MYKHQEKALRKIIQENRNVVIATGTGSGKTESFLLPILNHLFIEKETGLLGPGVRALLLYPMNALANDQLARLREILANYEEITFGRYTGETEREYEAAFDKHIKMFGKKPLKNELISRKQMWQSPPHILLTNYAMLEYLLLRPDDSVFFDGHYAKNWSYLVLDESHTYMGAKGIETAMLLRRLKDRITLGSSGKLRCIATSATLGGGEEDFPEIANFANQLFGEVFEYNIDNHKKQDVIGASRLSLIQNTGSWGSLPPEIYDICRRIVNSLQESDKIAELREVLENKVPTDVFNNALNKGKKDGWPAFLYEILKGENLLIKVQEILEKGPILLTELIELIEKEMEPSITEPASALVSLIDLASKAKTGYKNQPLLPARYHVFVRAIEGAYLSLCPQSQLFIDRYERIEIEDNSYPVFEISSCRQCGALYLTGTIAPENNRFYLKQGVETAALEYYLLLNMGIEPGEEDEDETVGITDNFKGLEERYEKYILCGNCGAIDRNNSLAGKCCDNPKIFHLLKMPVKDGKIYACPACGKISSQGIIWRFWVGADAATSVLAAALYREIEPKQTQDKKTVQLEVDDPWDPIQYSLSDTEKAESEQRKLLVFSDSRQDAAFFAPYLNHSYSRILRRGLILEVLKKNKEAVVDDSWRVQDIISPLQKYLEEIDLLPEYSKVEKKTEIWKWLIYELLALDRRNSLEGLGLIGFSLVKPSGWMSPLPLLQAPWHLTPDETWTLYQVLLDTLRQKGAIVFPDEVSPKDEFFQPRNREYYIREWTNREATKMGVLGWNTDLNNSRLDYLIRLARRINPKITKDECKILLSNIWRSFGLNKQNSIWAPYFREDNLKQLGTVFRLRNNFWELKSSQLDSDIKWHICDKCNTITLYNIRGICPSYRCDGSLSLCNPDDWFKENHYYKLYTNLFPIRMKAEEHTAQLTSNAAAQLQNHFIKGKVNVLSCSTTFELGVDVGELEAVFMRNMPPSTANYVQRAGRAGRRIDSVAYVLTFAQRRSHDLAHFQEPWRMVSGHIKPPYFKIENIKIVARHLYAVALSSFWRENRDYFGKVDDFFFKQEESGPLLFLEYLKQEPKELQESLKRIIPKELHEKLGLDNWRWVAFLYHEGEAVLQKAWDEIANDVEQLEELRIKLFQERKNVDHIERLITTLKSKNLIDYLSTRNVIPKYGFPVDVVELQLAHHGEEAKMLQLERDLRIALSEYAPSSQVVAGGKLWTSRYLKRVPKKEWESYRYAICDNCNSYFREGRSELIENELENKALKICPVCGQSIRNKGTFIIPAFGFISERQAPGRPGEEKPEKTYATRVYYSGCENKGDSVLLPLNSCDLVAIPASKGKLAIINNAGGRKFKVCYRCGYSVLGNEPVKSPHYTPWGTECSGVLTNNLALGHEFETDILMLSFEGYQDNRKGFWLSMLYGILEGISEALQIERQDLDGCLYYTRENLGRPVLIIFDDVPGGAGHVKRLSNEKTLMIVLKATLERLMRCECGGDEGNTSCYGCLRYFRNQYCHKDLDRGVVIEFLKKELAKTRRGTE